MQKIAILIILTILIRQMIISWSWKVMKDVFSFIKELVQAITERRRSKVTIMENTHHLASTINKIIQFSLFRSLYLWSTVNKKNKDRDNDKGRNQGKDRDKDKSK